MHGAHNTCQNACILSTKNAYELVHVRAEDSLPWKLLQTYLESCASIVQAVVCRSLLLPVMLSRLNLLPDAVCSRNTSKSTLAHDAVATAVLHNHYSIIRVSAGLIQVVYVLHSRLAADLILHKVIFPPCFSPQAFHVKLGWVYRKLSVLWRVYIYIHAHHSI